MSLQSRVMSLWRMHQFDTTDIARHCGISESEVYNLVSQAICIKEPAPKKPRKARARRTRLVHGVYYPNRFARRTPA